jgi:UDP-3-O-[3-hydroxymyristoyl] glucosamine N-acyltransferase
MTVEELAQRLGGQFQGERQREIQGIAALESAGPGDLAYAEGERALARAKESNAGLILVPQGKTLSGKTTIAVSHPKLALIRAAEILRPPELRREGIHPTAVVNPEAGLGVSVTVGPHTVIERGVRLGARTEIGAGVFLGENAEVGSECTLFPRVTVYAGARIGNRVIIHAGAVIGSDGFGYVFAEGRHHKFPQVGKVVIEDDVEIGANTTIDRGSLGTTWIGEGAKIDNLVQIAHNVRIGRHTVIAAQTGISGSVEVGDYVVMGGQVGIGDHVRIGSRAVLGGGAGILPGKIVRPGEIVWGRPGRPLVEFKRMYAHLSHLPALAAKVKELSRQIDRISS